MAKKLVAVLLASSYFLSTAAHFACAATMERAATPVTRQTLEAVDAPCCHQHSATASRSRKERPISPCCRMDAVSFALVNAAVVAPSATRGLCLREIAANPVAAPKPPRQTFGSDPDPPGSPFRGPALSSLSPRAPPFPPAVL